jgi:hypothetical protein
VVQSRNVSTIITSNDATHGLGEIAEGTGMHSSWIIPYKKPKPTIGTKESVNETNSHVMLLGAQVEYFDSESQVSGRKSSWQTKSSNRSNTSMMRTVC